MGWRGVRKRGGEKKVPPAQILSSSHIFLGCVMVSSSQDSQVHLASLLTAFALRALLRPSLWKHQITRLFSHCLCVRTCYSNQSILIHVDEGHHELLSLENSYSLVGDFWRKFLQPHKAKKLL